MEKSIIGNEQSNYNQKTAHLLLTAVRLISWKDHTIFRVGSSCYLVKLDELVEKNVIISFFGELAMGCRVSVVGVVAKVHLECDLVDLVAAAISSRLAVAGLVLLDSDTKILLPYSWSFRLVVISSKLSYDSDSCRHRWLMKMHQFHPVCYQSLGCIWLNAHLCAPFKRNQNLCY